MIPNHLINFISLDRFYDAHRCLSKDVFVRISTLLSSVNPVSSSAHINIVKRDHLFPWLTYIDAFDNHRIKSSVVQLFGLHPSMGPEVVWDSQVQKKKKKNPGDAVVAWENKQLTRQLRRKTVIGRQVRRRPAECTAAPGRTTHRLYKFV